MTNINLKVVLRDENPALMNQFLTNGSMSIPKLVVLDANDEFCSFFLGTKTLNCHELW